MIEKIRQAKAGWKRRIFERFFREFSNPLAGEDNQYLPFQTAGLTGTLPGVLRAFPKWYGAT